MVEPALVIPVYNERDCIASVVESRRQMLLRLHLDSAMLVIDDGSIDGTADVLQGLAGDPRIRIQASRTCSTHSFSRSESSKASKQS